MIELLNQAWPHWLRPYWLALLPLLCALLWLLWRREKRAGSWQQILPPAFHAALLSGGDGRRSRLPWLLLTCAWLLALVALVGPSWQQIEQKTLKPADPLVVMLELSPQMLAADLSPDRLEHAKRKIIDLLEARRDAQSAIVVYAGSAHTVVPLSDDLATSRNLLEALKPSIMPEPGHRADLALAKALDLLKQGGQGHGRLLLITSGLSSQEQDGIASAMAGSTSHLSILAVGTKQGAPITQEDGSFLKDAKGSILIPRLDSQGLSQFAQRLGAGYQRSTISDNDIERLGLLDGPSQMRDNGQQSRLQAWADQGHWLLLPLLLLAAFAGRRGWLMCLPLLLLSMPQPGYAFTFDDLWLRPDQQGQQLLQQNRPEEAAKHFTDPQWQAQALYQAGNYPGAAERFATSDSAAAHYNRGNALARSNELEAAIEAYDQALELQPDLTQAQKNKALIEQMLKQKQQEQNDKKNQQDQQNQQNQDKQQQQGQSQDQQAGDSQNPSQQAKDSSQQDAKSKPDQPSDPAKQQGADKAQSKDPGEQDKKRQGTQANAPDKAADKQAKAKLADDSTSPMDAERRQAMEQWLRQIPDDPGELLRRKFWYEQQQRQETKR
ncbi:VWA domain-containing protein [Pseudomonas segetis]|uniref:Ca-activated chloride channel family protein n=1 Tax=Pseudomonas segetis TaxID=298908 RepID=A0A238ZXM6_9PSED|nr:VWA domain-containing protein [Pseudomonas segetis]SNR88137.1 Ca-activated chloride channel family protein [Pseudomonas segetis]